MKLKYNYDYLKDYCYNNNIKLIKDYSEEKFNSNIIIEAYCKNCNNTFSKIFKSLLRTNLPLCKNCTKDVRKKTLHKNNLEKYGVINVLQLEENKIKAKKTILKKYGVDNVSKSYKIKKIKKDKSLEKFGTNCVLQSEEVKEKIKKTNLMKYGFENVSQNIEVSTKQNNYKFKKYTFPSGKEIRYQGYENYALDLIFKNYLINEDDIFNERKDVPNIWYQLEDNKKRRHFVDIYIKSLNKCIEVKSTWTLERHYQKVICKQKFARQLGYEYEIWVFNVKGELIQKI